MRSIIINISGSVYQAEKILKNETFMIQKITKPNVNHECSIQPLKIIKIFWYEKI